MAPTLTRPGNEVPGQPGAPGTGGPGQRRGRRPGGSVGAGRSGKRSVLDRLSQLGPLYRMHGGGTPGLLWTLLGILVLLSLATGALSGWAVSQHSSAAADVAAVHEPLSLDAQEIYAAVADADVTMTTALLASPQPPLEPVQRYRADIQQAATNLAKLKAAGGNQQLASAIAAFSAGLPRYTGYVAQAQSMYSLGYPLTGGSFLQVASEEAHLVLLPSAQAIYDQENAETSAASATATGLPTIIIALVIALVGGYVLFRGQRWLTHRTHRLLNPGLLGASAVLIVSAAWLVVTFGVARSDLDTGLGQGARPAEALAEASIAVQQIRGDAVLNVISRSGSSSFQDDFQATRAKIGPLLTEAAAGGNSAAAPFIAAAQRDLPGWLAANEQVYKLGKDANYKAERELIIGAGSSSSAVGYDKLQNDIGRALKASQDTFASGANSGAGAFGPLLGVVIAASLLMAAGAAWGVSRRISEYR
jgi:hypothetical protein